MLIYNVLFQSQRLENITGETDIKIDDGEEIHTETHYHLFIEKHGSIGNDYHELMTCLRKHQLALESVSRGILSSKAIILTVFANWFNHLAFTRTLIFNHFIYSFL